MIGQLWEHGEHLSEESQNVVKQKLSAFFSRRVETCADLSWTPVRGQGGDITYLGCDESYETNIPDFFDTSITSYSMTHFKPFDATLVKRLEPYLQNF